MNSNIQIKFLSLDEMANAKDIDWRYEHVGIDNLGFADKAKNRVFVRAGLEPQLQTLLIDHELSHLFELEGTDEDEHGIRHKKKGGFMKIFVPIIGAILGGLLGGPVGSGILGPLTGGLLGGATGTAIGTGAGTMLGGVAGSSATGKPNWLGNTISGATAGVGSGLGSALGGVTGSNVGIGGALTSEGGLTSGSRFLDIAGPGIASTAAKTGGSGLGSTIGSAIGSGVGTLFSGALGQGQSAQGGYGPGSSGQSFRMPDFSQQANANPFYSGWSQDVVMPEMSRDYGQKGAEMTDSMAMGGQSRMPTNPGLGQAGINLEGQEMGQGFSEKSMDQMFDPAMLAGGIGFGSGIKV